MIRLAYVNGRYLPHHQARVHIEDRGFQLADGVYEVIAVHHGRMVDKSAHLERLAYSLGQLALTWPSSPKVVSLLLDEVVRRNRIDCGWVYLQITRGSAPRDMAFPKACKPTLIITAGRLPLSEYFEHQRIHGVRVITIEDIRWKRRDIKSISLLAQVLGKQQAVERKAFESWMVDDNDLITEGCSSNAWIVDRSGLLITHPADRKILKGVTRASLFELARRNGLQVESRPFSRQEALSASEAMITSTRIFLLPVIEIDDQPIGNGRPGPVFARMYQLYLSHLQSP